MANVNMISLKHGGDKMVYSVMVILFKHNGKSNMPDKLMDNVAKYHLSKKAKIKQYAKNHINHDDMMNDMRNEIDIFLKEIDRKLLYFGINGERLNKIIGEAKPERTPRPEPGINRLPL